MWIRVSIAYRSSRLSWLKCFIVAAHTENSGKGMQFKSVTAVFFQGPIDTDNMLKQALGRSVIKRGSEIEDGMC